MQPSTVQRLGTSSRAWAMSALVNRNFALFLGGSFITAMGSWFQSVAIGWLVLELGNSTFLLGAANFAQMAPLLVLGLLGGTLADRTDRRRLLLVTQIGATAISAILTAITYLRLASIPSVMVLIFVIGVCNAFMWPAWPTFIKDLVGADRLRVAISTNSARYNLTRVLGPAMAGVFLAEFGTAHSLAVGAATGIAVILALFGIRLPPSPQRQHAAWLPALGEGLAYAWLDREVRLIMLVTAAIAMLGMSYQAFMPAFARDILDVGAWGLGLLLMAVGIGAVSGAVFSGTPWACRNPQRTLSLLGLGTGLSLLAFAYAPHLIAALLIAAVMGFCSIGYLVTGNATVQLKVPEELMGRVMGLWTVINAGTMPLGALALGALAEAAGLRLTLGLAGGVCALAALVLFRRTNP